MTTSLKAKAFRVLGLTLSLSLCFALADYSSGSTGSNMTIIEHSQRDPLIANSDPNRVTTRSDVHIRPNPFFANSDPNRGAKESFRLYIDSISRSEFDIAVSASDTIARTLEVASGWRKIPLGALRVKTSVNILTVSPAFLTSYGSLPQGLIIKNTDFLVITESQIVIRTLFNSIVGGRGIEVVDKFIFQKDQAGWFFDSYDASDSVYPCMRPFVWRGGSAPCQAFQR